MFNLGLSIVKLVLGFANNSSSSHSIIFLKKDGIYKDELVEENQFGWEYFTVASRESKLNYIALTALSSCPNPFNWNSLEGKQKELESKDKISKILSINFLDNDWAGIDHQSLIRLPVNWEETSIHEEFLLDFAEFMLHPRILILGGNDNDEGSHHLMREGRKILTSKDFNLEEDSSSILKAKKDGEYWTVFNKTRGNSLTFSFKENIEKLENV